MQRKSFYLIVVLLTLLFSTYFKSTPDRGASLYDKTIKTEYGRPIKVVKAEDGDTVVLENGEVLRYVGIDTPEEVDPRKPVQCFAREAADENKRLVEGKEIIFYKDISEKDKYGRWLGYVYLIDGTFINLELVKNGYGFAYPYAPDTSKKDLFKEAEADARQGRIGLWASCEVRKLSSGREQTNDI